MKFNLIMLILLGSMSTSAGEFTLKRKNKPLSKVADIKCVADHTVAASMAPQGENEHSIEIKKIQNQKPREVVIQELKGKQLVVDDELFKIVKTSENEMSAISGDEKTLISIVLNYKYGTVFYNKIYSDLKTGVQSSTSFVGLCENKSL